jgi:hypothetical protein
MNELEDLIRFFSDDRKERQYHQLLKTLGYLDLSAEDFGFNKWTQLLSIGRSEEEYKMREFPEHEPGHLVSVLAIPDSFTDLKLDVGSQAFREWLSSLKWDYCPAVESPFRHSRQQACYEGILLPVWVNSETQSVLERFLVIHRSGVAELGLGAEVCYHQQDAAAFNLIHIVGRIWQFIGFYLDIYGKFFLEEQGGVTFLVNIRGTRNALLGNLAPGWKEPRLAFPEAYNPKCPDKHLQFAKSIAVKNPDSDIEMLVHWFATRIDNSWGHFQPRCYVPANLEESQPFAHPSFRR